MVARQQVEGVEECILGKLWKMAVASKWQKKNACWKEESFVGNTRSSSKLEEERQKSI